MTAAELATRHDTTVLAPVADYSPSVANLVEWADAARAAHTIAESLVKTSFVPKQFRDKPHEATAAILSGTEVGLSPMAALRSFDIIDGTAAARAATLRAIVQSRGHDIWLVESNEHRCIMEGQRAGSSRVQRSVWTIDRAQKLRLTGKDNWQKQPIAMLVARATSEIARMVASDAILGIPYSTEELRDGAADVLAVENNAAPATPRTARRRAKAEAPPMPEPDADTAHTVQTDTAGPDMPEPDVEPDTGRMDTTPGSVTRDQQRHMFALASDLGMDGEEQRDERLAYASEVIGRTLTSSNDLSVAEASQVIDRMIAWKDQNEPPEPAADGAP
jgi:hypothetical protein